MSDSATEIGFAQLGLGSVLKQYHLTVPINQREYAWEEKEVTTLFKDFARSIRDGDRSYFLGTIVTIPRGGDVLEVVDGQQRLATAAILLAAIRDYIDPLVLLLAEHINGEILTGIDTKVLARVPRLTLNLDDNDYFRARLTGAKPPPLPTKPSHRLIDEAFQEAQKRVKTIVAGLDKKDHGDTLKRWLDFVVGKALVILLRVPNPADAYRMFETLNDRGKRTSQSDLVKNYLFGRAATRQPEAHQSWAFMRGALETISDEDDITIMFLRHALILIRGFVREADVFETVQSHAQHEQPVVTFAGQLEDLANVYAAIWTADHERWNKYSDSARRALEVINLFDIAPMRPLVLAVSRRFSEKEAERAFKFFVSLAVRLLVTGGTRTGSTEESLAEAAHRVFIDEITLTLELATNLKSITPGDALFRQAFESATVSNHKLARYYLRSLEMTAKAEPEPWHIPNDDKNIINLEHVTARKANGQLA